MIRVRFLDATTGVVLSDAVPTSLGLSWKLSQTEDWNASFPKNDAALVNVSQGALVQIFFNQNIILDGILQSIGEKWGSDSIDVALTGRGILDKLFDIRSYSYGYYENKERLLILALLLDRAGWRLGDISTWASPAATYTIDLRNDKKLLSQITTLMSGFPGVFFRYGGSRAGKFTMDVGSFNSVSDVGLYKSGGLDILTDVGSKIGLIADFGYNQALTAIVNSVEVWGGAVQDDLGVKRTIFLKDALVGNPALAADPKFPIVTDLVNYIYYIRNNSVPIGVGAQSTERFSQYSPESTQANATPTAITTAALALYERGVAYLLDRQLNPKNLSVKAEGYDLFMNVGDQAYVSITQRQPIIDPFTDQITSVIESKVQDYFRVTSLKLDAQDGKTTWSFELTNGTVVTEEDLFVSVYDQSKTTPQVQGTAAISGLNFPQLSTYIQNVPSGQFSNTTMSDGSNGLLVTITQPITGLPGWTPTRMFSAGLPVVSGITQPILVELVQDFIYGVQPLIVKIGVKNSGWVSSNSLNLTYYVVWSQ